MVNTFWLNNPNILFEQFTELWPKDGMTFAQKLNAISRCVFIMTCLGYLWMRNIKIVVSGLVTLIVIVLWYKIEAPKKKIKEVKEGFANFLSNNPQFTAPTENNPLMNVQLPQIKDDPKRKMAEPSFDEGVKKVINTKTLDYIEKDLDNKLFHDMGDKIEFGNSMRNFYAMPSTTVPNNQTAFSEFCYGNMPSCKEGEVFQCLKNNTKNFNVHY
jgi:hypothetical protein